MPAPYIISLAVECLVGIADGISKLAADDKASAEVYKKMAECSWPSILAALSMLFSKSNDESFAQARASRLSLPYSPCTVSCWCFVIIVLS